MYLFIISDTYFEVMEAEYKSICSFRISSLGCNREREKEREREREREKPQTIFKYYVLFPDHSIRFKSLNDGTYGRPE